MPKWNYFNNYTISSKITPVIRSVLLCIDIKFELISHWKLKQFLVQICFFLKACKIDYVKASLSSKNAVFPFTKNQNKNSNFQLLSAFYDHFLKSSVLQLWSQWRFLSEIFSKASSFSFMKSEYTMIGHGPYFMPATLIFQKHCFFKKGPKKLTKISNFVCTLGSHFIGLFNGILHVLILLVIPKKLKETSC